jgi:hypothetical protein
MMVPASKLKIAAAWATAVMASTVLVSNCGYAATLTYSQTWSGTAPIDDNLTLEQFNPGLGTLTGVELVLNASATEVLEVLNFTDEPLSFTNGSASTPITVTGPAGTSTSVTASVSGVSGTVPGVLFSITPFAGTLETLSNSAAVLPADFGFYEGLGTFMFNLLANTGTYGGTGNNLGFGGSMTANGNVTVEYTYDAVATPLPAGLPLFATGLGVLGVLGRRRKRKNAAAIVANRECKVG